MTIGAVVVTYHTSPRQLSRCLKGLRQNKVDQIIVVDNENNQHLAPLARVFSAQYLPQSKNLGFAYASHAGALKLNTDLILFINPDAIILPPAVSLAKKYLNQHPRAAVIGLKLENQTGDIEPSYGRIVTPLSILTRKFKTSRPLIQPALVGWVSGAAMIIRRPAYQAAGGFDPEFFMYWEDVDLCRRLSRLDWQIVYLPGGRVRHQRGASLRGRAVKTRLYDESADKYWRKHYPRFVWLSQQLMRSLYRRYSTLVD